MNKNRNKKRKQAMKRSQRKNPEGRFEKVLNEIKKIYPVGSVVLVDIEETKMIIGYEAIPGARISGNLTPKISIILFDPKTGANETRVVHNIKRQEVWQWGDISAPAKHYVHQEQISDTVRKIA